MMARVQTITLLVLLLLLHACSGRAHRESTPPVPETTPPVCGNGVREADEQCDDANDLEWDGCRECQIVEFLVNSTTEGNQMRPDVEVADDGSFVAVWQQETEEKHHFVVRARLFDPIGRACGPDFLVHEGTGGNQRCHAVDMDGTGRFVVVWTDDTTQEKSIKARIFSPEGQPATTTIEVYTHLQEKGASHPEVVLNKKGGFLVSWGISAPKKGGNELHFALLDSAGMLMEHTSYLDEGCVWGSYPSLASLDWGYAYNYTCSQPMKYPGGPNHETRFGFLSAAAEPSLHTTHVGTAIQGLPLAILPENQYVLSAGPEIYFVGSDGKPNGDAILIAEDLDFIPGLQGHIAADASGRFVSTWSSWSKKDDVEIIRMRILEPDGSFVTKELQVNDDLGGSEKAEMPRVDITPDGRYVIVWQAKDQDGDGYGIFAQRFTRDGEPMGVMPW